MPVKRKFEGYCFMYCYKYQRHTRLTPLPVIIILKNSKKIAGYLGIADFISAIVTPSVALAIELSSASEPCI